MPKGSQIVWGGWEPRVCAVCGQRVTLKESSYHGGGPTGRPWSIHAACGGPKTAHQLANERRG